MIPDAREERHTLPSSSATTAEDGLVWRSRYDAMLRPRVHGVYRHELADVDLDELAAAARTLMADDEPRSMSEVAQALAEHWRTLGPRALAETVIAALVPVVQLPPRGLWRTKARVRRMRPPGSQTRTGSTPSPSLCP